MIEIDANKISERLCQKIIQVLNKCISFKNQQSIQNRQAKIEQRIHLNNINLKKLNFSKELIAQCLEKVVINDYVIKDKTLSVLNQFTKLETLQINSRFQDQAGRFLNDYCLTMNLKVLKIDANIIYDHLISFLQIKGPQIEEILIEQNRFIDKFIDLCPNLNQIELQEAQQLPVSVLNYMKKLKLKKLLINEANLFTQQGFESLFSMRNEKLEFVEIKSCYSFDDSLNLMLQNAPKLKSLYLTDMNQIKNEYILQIARYGQNLQQLCFDQLNQITNESLQCVFKSCRMLKGIILANIRDINKETLQSIHQNCAYLSVLEIINQPFQKNDLISELIKFRSLSKLVLRYCSLTNKEVKQIITNCINLKYLDMSDNSEIYLEDFPTEDESGNLYPIYKSLKKMSLLRTGFTFDCYYELRKDLRKKTQVYYEFEEQQIYFELDDIELNQDQNKTFKFRIYQNQFKPLYIQSNFTSISKLISINSSLSMQLKDFSMIISKCIFNSQYFLHIKGKFHENRNIKLFISAKKLNLGKFFQKFKYLTRVWRDQNEFQILSQQKTKIMAKSYLKPNKNLNKLTKQKHKVYYYNSDAFLIIDLNNDQVILL